MEAHVELAHRTTILLTPALHDRLTRLARQRGVSMGALIRAAVEAQYGGTTSAERLAALEELTALALPVGSTAAMKAESTDEPGFVP
jgi:predicted DNA-binding ribbon-helix-helix protein